MIKEGILFGGLVMYAFIINQLVDQIRDQNFTKSFLRIIDDDDNGIITKKEMKEFNICPQYDGKKLKKEFGQYGKKADLNELSEFLTPKLVMKMVSKCVRNADQATNIDHLKNLKREELQKELLQAFDLDNNKEIRWGQFNIATQHLKKSPRTLRMIFKFFDKDHSWKLTQKEMIKAKTKNLPTYIASFKYK